MADQGSQKVARERRVGHRVAKHVIEKRVTTIGAWLIQGHRRATIVALVSEAVKVESEKRAAATRDSKQPPPYVWGDVDPPVSEQQIKKYIRRARAQFELTGRELPKKTVEVLGMTWERLNDLYWRALADKRYTVCRQLIRDQMEMFGLVGAIKVQLVVDNAGSSTLEPDASHLPETEHTAEQLAAEWSKLLQIGLARVRANPDQRFLPPAGLPVTVTAAPAERDDDEDEDADDETADD